MVKNAGGNKTKRDARKYIAPTTNNNELRVVVEKGETYAVVKKLLGCGQCLVTCLDGKSRICMIRNKFKGRGRSSNTVEIGAWLLVGVRDWEVKKNGKETVCDLLHVYSFENKEKLLQKNDINFTALIDTLKQIAEDGCSTLDDSGFYFVSNTEISYQELLSNHKTEDKEIGFVDADFNINDI